MDEPSDALVFKVFIAGIIIVGLVAFSTIMCRHFENESAIKAGLVQKVDDHGNIIWVKP